MYIVLSIFPMWSPTWTVLSHRMDIPNHDMSLEETFHNGTMQLFYIQLSWAGTNLAGISMQILWYLWVGVCYGNQSPTIKREMNSRGGKHTYQHISMSTLRPVGQLEGRGRWRLLLPTPQMIAELHTFYMCACVCGCVYTCQGANYSN